MSLTTYLARVMASVAVLSIATSAMGQEPRTTESTKANAEMKCPVMGPIASPSARITAAGTYSNGDWWPNQLNLQILHQNSLKSNPMGGDFNYAE